MRISHVFAALSASVLVCSLAMPAAAQVPPEHAEQIRKAAREIKASAAPEKPRVVLIWNTPSHLMDKDPHKGYCIPYGEEAMKAIGETSGAFKPVVSDDLAVFAPENLKRFDAIVLNNASGNWITPTAADLAKESLKKLGTDAQESRPNCARASSIPGKRRGHRIRSLRHRGQPPVARIPRDFRRHLHRASLDRRSRGDRGRAGKPLGRSFRRQGFPHRRRDLRVRASL